MAPPSTCHGSYTALTTIPTVPEPLTWEGLDEVQGAGFRVGYKSTTVAMVQFLDK